MTFTKILCTLGPATDGPGMVTRLVQAGMSAARINFSHGGEDAQRPRIEAVRAAERELGRPLAVVADLQGPKIRIGRFPDGPIEFEEDQEVTIAPGDGPCSAEHLTVDYNGLLASLAPGADLYIADGLLQLHVEEILSDRARCRVVRGGMLSDRKGVNLPGVAIDMPTLTEKDYRDAKSAIALGADYIALSFVRRAEDIETLRGFLHAHGGPLPIIAKLERPEAIERLDAILDVADAVMVARGDLGVEVGVQFVPVLQKRIIEGANRRGKPVIVATQMLESMTTSPLPTRAEASDVANAILDGADAVMLSGETAAGRFPLEAVKMMSAIATETEPLVQPVAEACACGDGEDPVPRAVVDGVLAMVDDLAPRAIVAYTSSGFTARLLSKRRAPVPVIALAPSHGVARQCSLYYGCCPLQTLAADSAESIYRVADRVLLEHDLAEPGDRVIIVAGLPFAISGTTNLIHVRRVERE
jgi:pyruvate kinase